MIEFAKFRRITIPEGKVVHITDSLGRIIWRRQYLNLVLGSVDKNGNIYNGTGYKDNYDIRSSTGEERARSGSMITGFIPIEVGAKIYIKNGFWGSDSTVGFFCSFTTYDENFNYLNGAPGKDSTGVHDTNNSTAPFRLYAHKVGSDAVLELQDSGSSTQHIKYYRISLKKTAGPQDLIITHNEEV